MKLNTKSAPVLQKILPILFGISFIFIINISFLTFISCVSITTSSQGPFYRANLITEDLMIEIIEPSVKIRIIYPYIAKDATYKKIINTFFLAHIEEYRIFNAARKENNFLKVIAPQSKQIFHLSIYSYTILDQTDTVSIAFHVQYKTTNAPVVSRWYTLNINTVEVTIIEDETLFSNPLSANAKLISYAFDDIIRQRTERLLPRITQTFNPSTDSNIDAVPLSFVLLPSVSQKYKFSGLRIYISQFTDGETNQTNYAINIPFVILRPYLRNDIKNLFHKENVPFITRDLDSIRKFIYPDLTDIF